MSAVYGSHERKATRHGLTMEYLDARRLTGPNLLWDRPGSILDVACAPDEADRIIEVWSQAARAMLDAVGWGDEAICVRKLKGGVSLAFSAPIDALYAATEINECAWTVVAGESGDAESVDFEASVQRLRAAISEELNPGLLALEAAAAEHDVAFLWDDDDVSIGHGSTSSTWSFRDLPDPDGLDWSRFHDVPVGIVTGTNGKTTTVRLATHIGRQAGHSVGVSCTDWIAVNDRIIDRDDWSGPGGARNVLRQPDVDFAILETARGGLLRRGLGVNEADAALITNIAEDHLGDFGSQSLEELLDIKWVVSHAVRDGGTLILNADDQRLVAKSTEYDGTIVWFSLSPDNPVVTRHLEAGGAAFVLDDGDLLRIVGAERQLICRAGEIPITLGGAARHNIANALAAAALTSSLGVAMADVAAGLKSMVQENNPGRCNVYDAGDVRVIVDFAHNPAAMQSLFDMATALPAKRRLLAFGQAGDRPDALIRELARNAWSIGLDVVVISELAKYYRGRDHGEVFAIIRDELLACGADAAQIHHFEEEIESLDFAIDWAEPGDLVIMLALERAPEISERLESLAP